MQEFEEFLETYQGHEFDHAREAYEYLRYRAEAALEVFGELGPHDARLLLANSARELIIAETIGYRFQSLQRRPIVEDAIFIEDVDHAEYNLTPGGSVSYRRDWADREDELVEAFLVERYPLLSEQFTEN
jgi:hypothetical protein